MKARHQATALATLAIAFSGSLASSAAAQAPRGPNPNAPHLMVGTFKNTDKKLGPDAAEAIRNSIAGDVSYRDLYVIPKNDLNSTLEASGYSTTDALSSADANALAKLLRADEYIEGSVTKTATGYELQANLVLTRDPSIVQPLGTFDGNKLDNATDKLSKEFQNANKQFDYEKRCRQLSREGKNDDALKEVERGIKEYGRGTWVRLCELQVMIDTKRPAADVQKVVDEIIAIDPKSKPALAQAVTLADRSGNKDQKIKVLLQLLSADPGNPRVQADVVNELAAAGKVDLARPIIEKAVADNPGDVSLVKLYWLVLGAMNDYKKFVSVGEDMVKMDTSLATADFYKRMVSAYATDSQMPKAAETAARATAKFKDNAEFWAMRGQLELRTGQVQQAVTSLKTALQLDPKTPGARMLIINSLYEAGQYDSAFVAMKEAAGAGENGDALGQVALAIGKKLYDKAYANDPKVVADFQKTMPYLQFADSLSKDKSIKTNAKFLQGVSSFFMGTVVYTDAAKAKSCDGMKQAQGLFNDASYNVPQGGATSPAAAQQIMGNIAQFGPAIDQAIKVLCKGKP